MTATEMIARQEQTGRLSLTLRGMFYTAYNGSAQALAPAIRERITVCDYKKVIVKQVKQNKYENKDE